MMTFSRIARWIVALPFLLLLVVFALSNTHLVKLNMFPTDFSVEVPISIAILGALGLGFFLGGFRVWLIALKHRDEAKRAQYKAELLEIRQNRRQAQSELRPLPTGSLLAPPR